MTSPHKILQLEWRLKKQKLKITQAEAAAHIGWTQSAFSQYLNGTTKLNPSAIIKFATFLDIPPSKIDPSLQVLTSSSRCPHCKKEI